MIMTGLHMSVEVATMTATHLQAATRHTMYNGEASFVSSPARPTDREKRCEDILMTMRIF